MRYTTSYTPREEFSFSDFSKNLKSFYRVVKEGQPDRFQLLRQRSVMPLAAPPCKCGLLADMELLVSRFVDHVKARKADGNEAKR